MGAAGGGSYRLDYWMYILLTALLTHGQQTIASGGDHKMAEWSPWSPWSECSRTCGLGISSRSRKCLMSEEEKKMPSNCLGRYKEFKTCKPEDCPAGTMDFRSTQCAEFNSKLFMGRRYQWEPFRSVPNVCELSCRARGHRFYARLAHSVIDGTPCEAGSPDICVNGKCQAVGCDGVLGSGKKFDKCGVCGGDNVTCHIVNGIFTRTHLEYGYNKIATIPAGACNINITELKHSRNYLALRYTSGKYVVNGGWAVDWAGDYQAGGTSFKYLRPSKHGRHHGEQLLAVGPTNASMDMMVLFQHRNPGIMYAYTIPIDEHSTKNAPKYPTNGAPQTPPKLSADNNPDEKSELTAAQKDQSQTKTSHGNYRVTNRNHPDYDRRLRTLQTPGGQQAQHNANSRQRSNAGHQRRPGSHAQHQNYRQTPPQRARPSQQLLHRANNARNQQTGPQRATQQRPLQKAGNEYPNYRQHVPQSSGGAQLTGNANRRPHVLPLYRQTNQGTRLTNQQGVVRHQQPPVYIQPSNQNNAYQALSGGTRSQSVSTNEKPLYVSPYRNSGTQNKVENSVENRVDNRPGKLGPGQFSWRISGFTKCSASCGGGSQETVVVCVKGKSEAVVTDENCDSPSKPTTSQLTCNTNPCQPAWEAEEWAACSASCGKGTKTRKVECKQLVSAVLHMSVSASLCADDPKPAFIMECEDVPCTRWLAGEWGQCSADCGRGQRSRTVRCVDHQDQQIDENRCLTPKPGRDEICDMGSCAKTWFFSAWSQQCSSDCGEGVHTREVHCASDTGKCNPATKPRTEKKCKNDLPCGGKWFTGPWNKCTSSCSSGVQKRDVVCMKKLSGGLVAVVTEDNCLPEEKPRGEQQCDTHKCKAEWYTTEWTKCTKTCDTGFRSREVKCLEENQKVSTACITANKPDTRQTCNTVTCPRHVPSKYTSGTSPARGNSRTRTSSSTHTAGGAKEPGCKDKYTNCRLVVQARLCRYSYYKGICCNSCSAHSHHEHHKHHKRNKRHQKS